MKFALLIALLSLPFVSRAEASFQVNSEKTAVEIARVVKTYNLVSKPGILVNVSVLDHGGSTDVSPTQTAYLTLYVKGEMFSTDAAFRIADVLSVKSARRFSDGSYAVVASVYDDKGFRDVTYRIDARRAVMDIRKVDCGVEFDCDASEDFRSFVTVSEH